MKFDKETIIGLCICFALLIFWNPIMSAIFGPLPQPKPQAKTEQQMKTSPSNSTLSAKGSETVKSVEQKKTEPAPKNAAAPEEVKKPDAAGKTETVDENIKLPSLPDQTISNDFVAFKISPSSGSITSIEFKKFLNKDKKKNIVINEDYEPGALSFSTTDKLKPLSVDSVKESETSLRLTRGFMNDSGQRFSVIQTWKLVDKYKTAYGIEIKNLSDRKLSIEGIHVSAGSIIPILELSGDYFIVEAMCINTCLENTVAARSYSSTAFDERQENLAKWIAVSNKYFTCILKPETPFRQGDGNTLRQTIKTFKDDKGKEKPYSSMETSGVIGRTEIEPGADKALNFTYFSGPKELSLLKEFDPKAADIMNLCYVGDSWFFGWYLWFEPIAQGFLIALIWMKSFCGNYGISIILLTFIVKMIFWPVTDRANASMRKMQKIQPLVQEIRTKYKDDAQKMNTKIMQLYKEHKVNPLGGCLPILLQIPIFIALYSALNGAIELRQSSFLWAFDLSRPDTIGMIPGIDLAINPLVLMMTVTMVIQQYLTPSAMDPVQQKMMMILPLVMLVLLYSLPSGLTLYWTVSQIISIVQLLVNKRIDQKEKMLEKKTA